MAESRLVETFLDLVRIPSEARDERAVADHVIAIIKELGLEYHEDGAAETIPAGCGNILVRVPATAPGTPIFLCSHLDTVTLEDTVDPVIEEGGKITNRNQAILGGDNKGAVAVMIELLRELVAGDYPHAGVEVVFTPCEEIGLLGAKAFDVSTLEAKCGFVYDHGDDIGKIVVRAPTQISYSAEFIGVASHSGIAPEEGRSAIRAAGAALERVPWGRVDEETTANVGLISGGTAVNIVAERCTLRGELRSLNHNHVANLAQELQVALAEVAATANVDLHLNMREEYRGYEHRPSTQAMQLAEAALTGAGYEVTHVPCGGGSDANIFNAAGKPSVNLCNAMRKIHTPDEYMMIEDLEGMLRVSRALVAAAVG